MYTTIRTYNVDRKVIDETIRSVRDEFIPMVSAIPGFLEYELVDAGDRLASISTFESKEGAEESTRRAAQFIRERANLAAAVTGRQITEGEVKVHRAVEAVVGAS
jgi:hypothetical protein